MLQKCISIFEIVLFVLIILIILFAIELYSDDFYYITFLDNGITSFISENIHHYQNVNGRVLVHILDEIILHLGKVAYMFFLPTLLLAIFFISSKILSSNDSLLFSISISALLFLHINVYVLKETSFWITGALNYIFPIFMTLCSILITNKILENKKVNFGQLFLLFLASATTEQGFVMTFLFTIGLIILNSLNNKNFSYKIVFPSILVELLGFLTIFLSPASRHRAVITHTIFNYSIIKLFSENFGKLALIIVGENSIAILLCIFLFLLSFLGKKTNKILYLGMPISLITFVLHLFNLINENIAIIILSIIIVYVLISIFILFRHKDFKKLSLFLLVAVCSQCVAFGLGEVSYRTLFPLTILIVICTANIVTQFKINYKTITSIVLLITSIIYITPTCFGYYENKSIIDDMKESIKNYNNTGEININTNINPKYSHIMGYENGDFIDLFYKYYGIENYKDNVYFNLCGNDSILKINNKRLKYSAYLDEENIYLPIRFVIESLGGKCDWNDEYTTYSIGNYFVSINNVSDIIVNCSNQKNIGMDLSNSIIKYVDRSFININDIYYIINDTNCNITVGSKEFNF